MKVIKPQKLSVLARTFDSGDAYFFAVSALMVFDFSRGGEEAKLLSEVDLWRLASKELGSAAVDAGMPKERGEVLVHGSAFPRGGAQPTCTPRVALGTVDKSLAVFGDRVWEEGVLSDPEPFTEMPIDWEHAFGSAENPLGKSAPNVEDPEHLIGSPDDEPRPAGFGPYEITWPERASKAGTYDGAWREERYPGFPVDIDWSLFNEAPQDQQIEGYFHGDEAFAIELMHAEKARIEGKLPGVRARAFVTLRGEDGTETFREIETRLDTIKLFPRSEQGILIFHGSTKVAEDDARDVLHLMLGCEDLGQPKPLEHYREVLSRRLDRKRGHLEVLKDRDLMPARKVTATSEAEQAEAAAFAQEGLLRKNVQSRLPTPPPEEPTDMEELPIFVESAVAGAELERETAEKKKSEVEKEARAKCAAQGLDYDAIMKEAGEGTGGPPRFSATAELAKLHDATKRARAKGVVIPELEAAVADPDLERKLRALEAQHREVYRRFAHQLPSAPKLDDARTQHVRREVLFGVRSGKSFAGADFTGADLSELDLSGGDFRQAMLERADLRGTTLKGADLTGAVLARATMTSTDLSEAKLTGANLGLAKLEGADLRAADMSGATLTKADLSGACLQDATLIRADLSEAILAGADLSNAALNEASFIKTVFAGAKLRGADLGKCNLIEANIEGLDFTGAKLVSAVLLAAKGDGVIFRDANLENLRVVQESSLQGADFRGARLDGANLRGTKLAKSDFSEASLSWADFSECDLRGAKLAKADARSARFVRADLTLAVMTSINLMDGSLAKAILLGADLRGSNLFSVDFALAKTDHQTNLEGAHTKRLRTVEPRGVDAT